MAQTPEFVARAVGNEEELEAWGALVGRGFSHRPGDPTRFIRKYRTDPTACFEWTRVVEDTAAHRLVGSVRILDREMATGNPAAPFIRFAGVAEVCSDPDYRGRGVASIMMPDAVSFMVRSSGVPLSVLHAADAVRPLYERYGYKGIAYEYGSAVIPAEAPPSEPVLTPSSPLPGAPRYTVEAMKYQDDWRALQPLYNDFNGRRLGGVGWVSRSGPAIDGSRFGGSGFEEVYWTRWLPNATAGVGGTYKLVSTTGEDDPVIVGYLAIVEKPDGDGLPEGGGA